MNKNALTLSFFILITFFIFWFSKDFILFWDTIQFAGHHPQYYFENGFSSFFLPQSLDSGHTPIFGIYIAAIWNIFGKSLWASHLATMPFVFLNFLFAYQLGQRWISGRFSIVFPLVLLLIPQCISQFMLVSPDVVLSACFLGLLLSIENENQWLSLVSSLGLVLVNNRGFVVVIIFIIWLLFKKNERTTLRITILQFLPAALLFIVFQLAHFFHFGWIGIHSEMPWFGSFSMIDLKGIPKNVAIFIWRLTDFGMIIVWAPLLLFFLKNKSILVKDRHLQLLGILVIFFAIMTIPFKGLMQHRYFLPIIILAAFILLKWIFIIKSKERTKGLIIGLISLFLITGNLWIYPAKIAQGWDSTLAHLPYYSLQEVVINYLDDSGISKSEVSTAFPMRSDQSIINLTCDKGHSNLEQFQNKDEVDTEYILYSNVMNDFSIKEIDILQIEWKVIKEWRNMNMKMILYSKNQ
ncbi:MAG: hypothetical protein V3V00_06415 [Saprospiraceae bacterium]